MKLDAFTINPFRAQTFEKEDRILNDLPLISRLLLQGSDVSYIKKEKKMSRKLYTLLSLVLMLSFALTACGAPATEAPPAATEAPAGGRADTEGLACAPGGGRLCSFAGYLHGAIQRD